MGVNVIWMSSSKGYAKEKEREAMRNGLLLFSLFLLDAVFLAVSFLQTFFIYQVVSLQINTGGTIR